MVRILVVEDDVAIREMLSFSLRRSGFECETVGDGEAGLLKLQEQLPDIILLDWMLPGIDGIEFIRQLRGQSQMAKIPVIMLTAKGESEDMVKGLSVGADDYISKPFSPVELMARIGAVLRRCQLPEKSNKDYLQHKDLVMDTLSHRISVDGKRINIGPTEFRLLHVFMQNPERAYSRSQLLDLVWGETVYIEERTVDVHIRRLRKALESFNYDKCIETVRGIGYRFSV